MRRKQLQPENVDGYIREMPEYAEGIAAYNVKLGWTQDIKHVESPYDRGDKRTAWYCGWLDMRTHQRMPHLFEDPRLKGTS